MYFLFRGSKDPVSSYTHFLGALLSVFATVFMAMLYHYHQNTDEVLFVSVLLFGFSLVALYTASSVYHYMEGTKEFLTRLRKFDHAMIYVLIAGTYTPICARFLPEPNRTIFLIGIWSAAVIGIIVKVMWLNAPRWLYTGLYLLMGWAVMFDFDAFATMPSRCLLLITLGGISYTVGAFVYIFKKPVLSSSFGFHEIFHVFIMIGSAFHVAAVVGYVL